MNVNGICKVVACNELTMHVLEGNDLKEIL